MYLEHFGLKRPPFALTPDPNFLFLTAGHREALAALLAAVTGHKGFMVMTGDAGTGKTTLIRKMLLSIPSACAQFSVIVNPALTRSELMETMLMDFGIADIPESKALRLALFRKLLTRAHEEGRTSVLVIDEAHLLTNELIEEVRLLSNFETSDRKLLQIILAGQNELNSTLAMTSLRQLRQRVAMRVHIEPLSEPDVARYLETRWTRASAERPLPFTADAVRLIARYSGGIPRVANVICDAALVNAFGSGASEIDVAEITEVVQDHGIVSSQADVFTRTQTAVVHAPVISIPKHVPLRSAEMPVASAATQNGRPERYRVEPRKNPKVWHIANWFGIAAGGAK